MNLEEVMDWLQTWAVQIQRDMTCIVHDNVVAEATVCYASEAGLHLVVLGPRLNYTGHIWQHGGKKPFKRIEMDDKMRLLAPHLRDKRLEMLGIAVLHPVPEPEFLPPMVVSLIHSRRVKSVLEKESLTG